MCIIFCDSSSELFKYFRAMKTTFCQNFVCVKIGETEHSGVSNGTRIAISSPWLQLKMTFIFIPPDRR